MQRNNVSWIFFKSCSENLNTENLFKFCTLRTFKEQTYFFFLTCISRYFLIIRNTLFQRIFISQRKELCLRVKWKNSLKSMYYEKKSEQWWSTIPPMSAKQTITFHNKSNHWAYNRLRHMTLKMQVLAWDRHKNVAESNRPMGSQS